MVAILLGPTQEFVVLHCAIRVKSFREMAGALPS